MNQEKKNKAQQIREEIWRLDEVRENKKNKAWIYTIIGLGAIIYFYTWQADEFESTLDYLLGIPISGFAAFLLLMIAIIITSPITIAGIHEDDAIKHLSKELYALEKELEKEQE